MRFVIPGGWRTVAAGGAVALAAVFVTGWFWGGDDPVGDDAYVGPLEPGPCPFSLPEGQVEGTTVRCGTITLSQDPKRPFEDREPVRLPVAVFTAPGGGPRAEPLLMLQGGPGGSTLGSLTGALTAERAAPIQRRRDIVLYDQRGTGMATPKADCPGVDRAAGGDDGESASPGEVLSALRGRIRDREHCTEDLLDKAVNPALFATEHAVADASAVMRSLGYERYAVYGVSYGTFQVFSLLERDGARIAAAILDAPVPPKRNVFWERVLSLDRATHAVAVACAADPACTEAFPDLEARFDRGLVRLLERPVVLTSRDPATNRDVRRVVTAATAAAALDATLRERTTLPLAARAMDAVARADWTVETLEATARLRDPAAREISTGVYWASLCREQRSPEDAELAVIRDLVRPGLQPLAPTRGAKDFEAFYCEAMNIQGPAVRRPVPRNAQPALVFAGQFDPATPPVYAEEVARSFDVAYRYEFPGFGHGVMPESACAMAIAAAFLDDPSREPDHAYHDALTALRFEGRGEPTIERFRWYEEGAAGRCDTAKRVAPRTPPTGRLCLAFALHRLPGAHQVRVVVSRAGAPPVTVDRAVPDGVVEVEVPLGLGGERGTLRVEVEVDGKFVGSGTSLEIEG